MGILTRLSKKFIALPLMGPHDNYEADLLLSGAKPIGLFVDVFPPDGVVQEKSKIMSKIRRDIKKLNASAKRGQLLQTSFTTQDSMGEKCIWHIFGQLDQKQNMAQLKKILMNQEESETSNDLFNQEGFYFGYRKQDMLLFAKGGYESLNPISSMFLKATHQIRHEKFNQSQLNDPNLATSTSTTTRLTSDLS